MELMKWNTPLVSHFADLGYQTALRSPSRRTPMSRGGKALPSLEKVFSPDWFETIRRKQQDRPPATAAHASPPRPSRRSHTAPIPGATAPLGQASVVPLRAMTPYDLRNLRSGREARSRPRKEAVVRSIANFGVFEVTLLLGYYI